MQGSLHRNKIVIVRCLQGAFLGIGAPIGWLFIRYLQNADLIQDILTRLDLYSYMLFGTVFVFSIFGLYVGMKEKQLETLSIQDPLTGLYNRRYFSTRLKEELVKSERTKLPTSLIAYDLDHFKRINDTYGHDAGDLILKEIGKVSIHELRSNEVIGRMGGEEFSVLLPECDLKNAENICKRLQEAIRKIKIPIGPEKYLLITASFGVADSTSSTSEEELLKNADLALYEAKHSGRNCIKTHKSSH